MTLETGSRSHKPSLATQEELQIVIAHVIGNIIGLHGSPIGLALPSNLPLTFVTQKRDRIYEKVLCGSTRPHDACLVLNDSGGLNTGEMYYLSF